MNLGSGGDTSIYSTAHDYTLLLHCGGGGGEVDLVVEVVMVLFNTVE